MPVEPEELARRLRARAEIYELDAAWHDDDETPGESLWRGIVAVALYEVACAITHEAELEEAA